MHNAITAATTICSISKALYFKTTKELLQWKGISLITTNVPKHLHGCFSAAIMGQNAQLTPSTDGDWWNKWKSGLQGGIDLGAVLNEPGREFSQDTWETLYCCNSCHGILWDTVSQDLSFIRRTASPTAYYCYYTGAIGGAREKSTANKAPIDATPGRWSLIQEQWRPTPA